jgi:hypothetical protein
MTALNFYLQPDSLLLAMDTLSLRSDHNPHKFLSKIFPILHLNGVMCGTGFAPLIEQWLREINVGILARDMIHLDEFTPQALQGLWMAQSAEIEKGTVTIYHFGYCEAEKVFKGYAYRSERDFQSETLLYGLGIKPGVDMTNLGEDLPSPQAYFAEIIKRQRANDLAQPINDRIGIGGDVHFVSMTADGIWMSRCHRFEDYDTLYFEMCKELPANKRDDS